MLYLHVLLWCLTIVSALPKTRMCDPNKGCSNPASAASPLSPTPNSASNANSIPAGIQRVPTSDLEVVPGSTVQIVPSIGTQASTYKGNGNGAYPPPAELGPGTPRRPSVGAAQGPGPIVPSSPTGGQAQGVNPLPKDPYSGVVNTTPMYPVELPASPIQRPSKPNPLETPKRQQAVKPALKARGDGFLYRKRGRRV